jgi:hypothetical protein
VHQLRYLLAYGPDAGRELVSHGDTYIHSVLPACLGLLLLPAGALLGHLAQAWRRGQARDQGLSPRRLWTVVTALLIVCFCAQEILEMLLETGHPAGLAGIFGSGGWWALPASAAVGALITLLVAGARAVVGVVARLRARRCRPGARRWRHGRGLRARRHCAGHRWRPAAPGVRRRRRPSPRPASSAPALRVAAGRVISARSAHPQPRWGHG